MDEVQTPILFDSEAIRKTKDFLWKYINDDNKQLLIMAATTPVLNKENLTLKELILSWKFV